MTSRQSPTWNFLISLRSLLILAVAAFATTACDIIPMLRDDLLEKVDWSNDEDLYDVQAEPTISLTTPGTGGQNQTGGGGGVLKPVHFANVGTVAYTVMPWTYIPPGGTTPAIPSNASTVSAPGGNPSSYLSLPMGTYTWCYWWELGDINNDKYIEYAHALDNRLVILDESDSNTLEFAETVTLSAPGGAGELPGQCGPAPNPSGTTVLREQRPNGELIFADDFSGGGGASALFGSEWMSFTTQGGEGSLTANGNDLILPAMYASPIPGDFSLEVDLTGFAASPKGKYAVIFRSDDMTDGLASYNIISLLPATRMVELGVWKDNRWTAAYSALIPEAVTSLTPPVHLRLEVRGGEYRVFVNGIFTAEFLDSQITSAGIFGLSLVTGSAPETLTFDNLRVYGIP